MSLWTNQPDRHYPRRVIAALTIFASLIAASTLWLGLSAASDARGASTASRHAPSALALRRHHSAHLHASQLHHAARVRAADHRRSHARWEAEVARSQRPPSPVAGLLSGYTGSSVYSEWSRVAVCEEGGWIGYAGYAFPDSLGIMRSAWFEYGGGADLSPAAQIAVGERLLVANGLAGWVPDQNGCAAW